MIFSASIELGSLFHNYKDTKRNLAVFSTEQDGSVVTSITDSISVFCGFSFQM